MQNITYTYGSIYNITRISNTAAEVNGLDGRFTYNYSYDQLYRLDSSWSSNNINNAEYNLHMGYSPSGNIISKTLNATKEILGNVETVNYSKAYTYNNAHMVSMVKDMNGTIPSLDFEFDAAGNMILQSLPDPNYDAGQNRLLCWDEENRLSATRDQYYATANIYDASGNRAWTLRLRSAQALGGEINWMWNNGQGFQAYGDLNLRTWYQSDLVTITDQAMTKHYFISGQRIASKLAESLAPEVAQNLKDKPLTPLSGDIRDLAEATATRIARDFECVGLDYNAFYPGETRLEALENLLNVPEQPDEYQVFFYHSDHLGSSSFITDINGDATQHLQYLPFGEDFVHQQNTAAYYTPYTFSGKERDVETNLSYFGARYYESSLSIWLSVDPLSDKYPSLSAYNYCALNPVMLVDPDGRSPNSFTACIGPINELIKKIGQEVSRVVGKAAFNIVKSLGRQTLNHLDKNYNPVTVYEGIINPNSNLESWQEKSLAKHSDQAVSVDQFIHSIAGLSKSDAKRQEAGHGVLGSQSGGPTNRYVFDPANSDRVIDMRHFLSVGDMGEVLGLGIEIMQSARESWRGSAYDLQDFYSNHLGHEFYSSNFYGDYKIGKVDFAQALRAFFQERGLD